MKETKIIEPPKAHDKSINGIAATIRRLRQLKRAAGIDLDHINVYRKITGRK